MRWNLVLTAAILVVAGHAAGGEWRLGLQGGANSSGLSGDTPSGISLGKQSGVAAGLIGEFLLTEDVWLSIQPMYLQRGTTSEIAVSGQEDGIEGPSISLDYVAVPILVRIVSGNQWTYVVGGLNPAFLLDAQQLDGGATEDVMSDLNGFDLSADIGFGLMVPLGRPTLSFEIRYEQSILNLADSGGAEENELLPLRFRSSGFLFMAGLLMPLGGK